MQWNIAVSRILGRCIDALGNTGTRCRAELVVEQWMTETGGELAKGLGAAHLETTQQNPAGTVQVRVDQRLAFGERLAQVETGFRRLDQHGQGARPGQQRPDIQTQCIVHDDSSPLISDRKCRARECAVHLAVLRLTDGRTGKLGGPGNVAQRPERF